MSGEGSRVYNRIKFIRLITYAEHDHLIVQVFIGISEVKVSSVSDLCENVQDCSVLFQFQHPYTVYYRRM